MMEFIYKIFGFRKCGAIDEKDSRDIRLSMNFASLPDAPNPPNKLNGGIDRVDARNIVSQNQGRKPWCVAYTTAHHISSTCTRIAGREITFEGFMVWGLMVKHGLCKMGDNGTLLRNGPKAIQKECDVSGYVEATDGSMWYFSRYEVVMREEFSKVMARGYTIITGQMIKSPMCDKKNVLQINGTGGHAFLAEDDYKHYYLGLNSFYRWGIKMGKVFTGCFWIFKIFVQRLFYSSFILLGAREVK